MRQYLFWFVINVVWILSHLYVGRRLIESWSPPKSVRIVGWSVLVANLSVALVATWSRMLRLKLPMAETIQWVTYFLMGIFVLILSMTLIRDLILVLGWPLFRRWEASKEPGEDAPEPLKGVLGRRRFMLGGSSAAIAGGSLVASVHGYREARRVPRVKRVEVPVKGLPKGLDGFKIVQLSDVHVGPTIKRPFLEAVIEQVNKLDADVVALTGDLVDGYVAKMREDVAPLSTVKARYGRFFVTGNHEYYWDGPAWAKEVERLGWSVLLNEHEVVDVEGAKLAVAGVTDFSAQRHVPSHKSDPHKAASNIPSDVAFKLLLAHQPKSVWAASKAGFDLQLSGHTHGGQFYPWNFVVGLAHPFSHGLHTFESMQIYVSRGTGYWGPPLRLGAPSEITLLTLKSV